MTKRLIPILLLAFSALTFAQAPFAIMPLPYQCFENAGAPLAGGKLYFYQAGTTTPQATYTDYLGSAQNTNPVILDSAGCAQIWFGPNSYKVVVKDANNVQIRTTDNLSDVGQLLWKNSVLLLPNQHALQTVVGPLAADYFQQTVQHVDSPGVRAPILSPTGIFDTATNPPGWQVDAPANPNQVYHFPDPGTGNSGSPHFVNSWGNPNDLDCSQGSIVCKRTAHVYFEGGGCNNTTSGMGWDTFGANSPSPQCVTGSNIQKGVLAFPSAVTYIQENSAACAASLTCTTTYPVATVAGDLLEVEIVVDGSKTVASVSDGTNAYVKAIGKAQGTVDTEIWYFNNTSASKAAATTLTVTYSAGTPNSAIHWKEYSGVVTGDSLDKTASNGNTGSTSVSTGTTAGTAQNTELVLGVVGAVGNATITGQNGYVKHLTVTQSTNVEIASQGMIQQNTTTQTANFTLGASELWAAVIATFKALVASDISAQRTWFTPTFFSTTGAPVASAWVWQAPQVPTGTVNVSLGAQVVCTVPGSTDDPTFNTSLTAIGQVSATGANIITYTPLTPLVSTGCAASNLLHLKVFRQRYNINDTYEGFVLLDGAPLFFGINQ